MAETLGRDAGLNPSWPWVVDGVAIRIRSRARSRYVANGDVCVYVCMCTCVYVYMCVYVYIYIYTYIYAHTYIYIYTYFFFFFLRSTPHAVYWSHLRVPNRRCSRCIRGPGSTNDLQHPVKEGHSAEYKLLTLFIFGKTSSRRGESQWQGLPRRGTTYLHV